MMSKIKNLTIKYNSPAVWGDEIDLDLNSHVTMLLNPSGDGKTFLFETLGDLKSFAHGKNNPVNYTSLPLKNIKLISIDDININSFSKDYFIMEFKNSDNKIIFIDEFDKIAEISNGEWNMQSKELMDLIAKSPARFIITSKTPFGECGYLDSSVAYLNLENSKFSLDIINNNSLVETLRKIEKNEIFKV